MNLFYVPVECDKGTNWAIYKERRFIMFQIVASKFERLSWRHMSYPCIQASQSFLGSNAKQVSNEHIQRWDSTCAWNNSFFYEKICLGVNLMCWFFWHMSSLLFKHCELLIWDRAWNCKTVFYIVPTDICHYIPLSQEFIWACINC